MRLTEAMSAFNLEFNPCDAQEKLYFMHIGIDSAREMRKAGQKAQRLLKKQDKNQKTLDF